MLRNRKRLNNIPSLRKAFWMQYNISSSTHNFGLFWGACIFSKFHHAEESKPLTEIATMDPGLEKLAAQTAAEENVEDDGSLLKAGLCRAVWSVYTYI